MEDMMGNVDGLIGVIIAVLLAVQAIVAFFLDPKDAEKFNIIGKILEFLVQTRKGLSVKKDEDANASKSTNDSIRGS